MQITKTKLKKLIQTNLIKLLQEYEKAGPTYFSRATQRPAMNLDPLPQKSEDDIDNNDGGAIEDETIANENKDLLDDPRFINLAKFQAKERNTDWRDVMLEFDEQLQSFLEQGGHEEDFYQVLHREVYSVDQEMGKTPPPGNTERADMSNSTVDPKIDAAYTKRAMESIDPKLTTPTGAPADPDDEILNDEGSHTDAFKDMLNQWYGAEDRGDYDQYSAEVQNPDANDLGEDEELAGRSADNPLEITDADFERWGFSMQDFAHEPINVAMGMFLARNPGASAEDQNKFLQFMKDFGTDEVKAPEYKLSQPGEGPGLGIDPFTPKTYYEEDVNEDKLDSWYAMEDAKKKSMEKYGHDKNHEEFIEPEMTKRGYVKGPYEGKGVYKWEKK